MGELSDISFGEGLGDARRRGGPALATVTRSVVRLYGEFYGRGATKARTDWVGEDMLVCVLGDCFTRIERTLIKDGRLEDVRRGRQVCEDALGDRLGEAVEAATGRHVIGLMGQISAEPECAVEIFLLAPARDERALSPA